MTGWVSAYTPNSDVVTTAERPISISGKFFDKGASLFNQGSTLLSDFFTPSPQSIAGMQKAAPIMFAAGAVQSAVGSYYQAKSAQYQYKSQALTMDFQKSMSEINARQAEFMAQQILDVSGKEISMLKMRAGKIKSASKASMAARGLKLGVGSTAEVVATTDLVAEMDAMTIYANAIKSSEAARTQSVNYMNQAMMQNISAQNLRATADTISPLSAAMTSFSQSANTLTSSWFLKNKVGS
jgi:hypothetical protein